MVQIVACSAHVQCWQQWMSEHPCMTGSDECYTLKTSACCSAGNDESLCRFSLLFRRPVKLWCKVGHVYMVDKLLGNAPLRHQRTKVGRRRRRHPARLLPLLHWLRSGRHERCSGISRLSPRPGCHLTRQGRPGLLARSHSLVHGLHRSA